MNKNSLWRLLAKRKKTELQEVAALLPERPFFSRMTLLSEAEPSDPLRPPPLGDKGALGR